MLDTLPSEIQEKIKQWLEGNYAQEDKKELQRLIDTQQSAELTDAFYKDLAFGTGGLRGIMGVGTNRMNQYTVGMATQGLANYLKQRFPDEQIKVVIAHDSRNHSDYFAQVATDVLSANGIYVYYFKEMRPTPELSFAIRSLNCHSGIVITASHNPKEYNGYKAYWQDGSQLIAPHDKNVIAEVKKIKVEDVKFEAVEANTELIGDELDEQYLETLHKLSLSSDIIAKHKDIKIVYTPLHGTGAKLVPMSLAKFGFENVHLVEEQAIPDGNFPTVIYPNPEEAEALNLAIEKAKEIEAELVMATDPDADRVGIAVKDLENNWILLNGNQTASLLFYYMLRLWKEKGQITGKEYIVKTIVTSELLVDIATDFGAKSYDTLTGFKYIAGVIRELEGKEQFIVGGEESYGYLIGDSVRDKDAVASCAFIAEMLAYSKEQGKSLFEMLLEIYQKYGFYLEKLISLTKKGKSGAEEIQQMMSDFRSNPPATLGGLKVVKIKDYLNSTEKDLVNNTETNIDLDKSNVLQFFTEDGSKISARPSGTEPKIKFYFSVKGNLANSENYAETKAQLEEKIKAMSGDLGL